MGRATQASSSQRRANASGRSPSTCCTRRTSSNKGARRGGRRSPSTRASRSANAIFGRLWSDDSAAKYAALATWAGAHVTEHECSPRLWLDKACIDQENIAASLACLPIYLSGCRKLLIVAGPTYATRLWCLMELFTFCKFNGSPDDIVLHTIGEPSVTNKSLATFNAANSRQPTKFGKY